MRHIDVVSQLAPVSGIDEKPGKNGVRVPIYNPFEKIPEAPKVIAVEGRTCLQQSHPFRSGSVRYTGVVRKGGKIENLPDPSGAQAEKSFKEGKIVNQ